MRHRSVVAPTILALLCGTTVAMTSDAGAGRLAATYLSERRQPSPSPSTARHLSDFNGDGYADLAIGVPNEDLGTINNAGAVNVLYGSPTPPNILSSTDDQKWTQNSAGVQEAAEEGDRFGWALARGDFDGDGYDDLAIGIKGERVGEVAGAGAVSVLYGSPSGLTAQGDQYFTQNTPDIDDTPEKDDNFGYALAVANFGYVCGYEGFRDDLAIGVRNEDLGPSKKNAGAVHVLYGGRNGLGTCADQLWTQDTVDEGVEIKGVADEGDRFGSSLEAGYFNGYEGALAIGVPEEDIGSAIDAGGVNELKASPGGLRAVGNEFWTQNKDSVSDVAETGDLFGYALAADNFGPHGEMDFQDDLAIGVPGEDGGEGAVHVLWGSWDCCLIGEGAFLTQAGTEEAGAEFGFSLAADAFAPAGVHVLAIGAPGDDVGAATDGGSITLQYWSGGSPGPAVVVTQDSTDVEDAAEAGDRFGSSLTFTATSGTYRAMLAIGVPEEDVASIVDAGAVNVLYGDSVDFDASDDQFWTQDSDGVNDSAEDKDSFGDAVA